MNREDEEEFEEKNYDIKKEIEEKKEKNENNNKKIKKNQINIILKKNNDEFNKNILIKKVTVKRDEIKQKKLNKEEENEKTINKLDKKLNDLNELSELTDSKLDLLISRTFRNGLKKKINYNSPKNKLLLFEKEIRLKNEQDMINNLLKENDKLKKLNEDLTNKLKESQDFFVFDKISLKNIEIQELKQKNSELSKNLSELNTINKSLLTKNEQLEEILIRYKKKINEIKLEKNKEKTPCLSLRKRAINYKNINQQNNISVIKENRLLKSASSNNFRAKKKISQTIREMINDSFYHLLSDKEKDSLRNLFNSNEEFLHFNKKLNIIETRNRRVENNLEKQISDLNGKINNQKKEINELKRDIELRDKKIRILEGQLNKLKIKNKILINNNKKNMSLEDNKVNDKEKDKIQKINFLINRYSEELNKEFIEKWKIYNDNNGSKDKIN